MLKRNFTIEEMTQFKIILGRYFKTQLRIASEKDAEYGQLVSAWAVKTLQQLENGKTACALYIDETVLEILKVCLHYTNCPWSIAESPVYLQFLTFASQFAPVEEKNTDEIETQKTLHDTNAKSVGEIESAPQNPSKKENV